MDCIERKRLIKEAFKGGNTNVVAMIKKHFRLLKEEKGYSKNDGDNATMKEAKEILFGRD